MMERIYFEIPRNGYEYVNNYGKVLTYADILDTFKDGFLNQLLSISIFLLVFDLYVLEYTRNWNLKPWIYVLEHPEEKGLVKAKILRSFAMACLPAALFYIVLIIGYKTGWFI